MFWFLSVPALWFLGKRARWLYSLDAAVKNQRRMRIEMRRGDAAQMLHGATPLSGSDLETLTRELQALGFAALGDVISRMDYEPVAPVKPVVAPIADPTPPDTPKMVAETKTDGVGRIFAHPSHGCYASLISVVSVSRFPPEMKRADMVNVAPFRTAIVTMSGNNMDSWSFGTHNREVQPFSLLTRHGRGLSHRMIGASSAAQLLQSHLVERDDIAARGGFSWDKAASLEKYQEFEARNLRHIRGFYERATTLGVAWKLWTFRFSKHERWMGELASR